MEWDKVATHLFAAGISFFGGLLFYFRKNKRRERRVNEAFVAAAMASLLGACLSMVICWKFCNTPDEKWLVIGGCGIASLMGLTPKRSLAWISKILGDVDDGPRNNTISSQGYTDPGSD